MPFYPSYISLLYLLNRFFLPPMRFLLVPVSSSEGYGAGTPDYPCCTSRGSVADELAVGPITLHTGTHLVHVADKPVPLTGAEFRVLELLMRSAGQVISREAMTEQALGRKLVAYDRSIDTHISNLRRKLDLEAGKNPEIKNVRGSGYTLTWAHA